MKTKIIIAFIALLLVVPSVGQALPVTVESNSGAAGWISTVGTGPFDNDGRPFFDSEPNFPSGPVYWFNRLGDYYYYSFLNGRGIYHPMIPFDQIEFWGIDRKNYPHDAKAEMVVTEPVTIVLRASNSGGGAIHDAGVTNEATGERTTLFHFAPYHPERSVPGDTVTLTPGRYSWWVESLSLSKVTTNSPTTNTQPRVLGDNHPITAFFTHPESGRFFINLSDASVWNFAAVFLEIVE